MERSGDGLVQKAPVYMSAWEFDVQEENFALLETIIAAETEALRGSTRRFILQPPAK